jgi:hypothetical protein
MQLQHLITSTPALRYLSDFVAICVIFVYSNPQTSRQAIAFLSDPAVQHFEFDDVELDYLMRALFQRPPRLAPDVKTCGEVIAHFCGRAENCRNILLEAIRPGHFAEESRPVLSAAARAVLDGGAGFSPAALVEIRDFVDSRPIGRPPVEATPTRERGVNGQQRSNDRLGKHDRTLVLTAFAGVIVIVVIALLIVWVKGRE